MHAVKGGWVGQTFALAKCNDSGGKKSRIRRSKEERKELVESFIKTYQKSNNGSFPSLNLTHKEVGGSFYTVREIVREVIQENKVLGPAKLTPGLQNTGDDIFEHYPIGSISIDPETELLSPNGSHSVTHIMLSHHEDSSGKLVPDANLQCLEPEHYSPGEGLYINVSSKASEMNEEHERTIALVSGDKEIHKHVEDVEAFQAKVPHIAADLTEETFSSTSLASGNGDIFEVEETMEDIEASIVKLSNIASDLTAEKLSLTSLVSGDEEIPDLGETVEDLEASEAKVTHRAANLMVNTFPSTSGSGRPNVLDRKSIEGSFEDKNSGEKEWESSVVDERKFIESASDLRSEEIDRNLVDSLIEMSCDLADGNPVGNVAVPLEEHSEGSMIKEGTLLGTNENLAGPQMEKIHDLVDGKPVGKVEEYSEDFSTLKSSVLGTKHVLDAEDKDVSSAGIKVIRPVNGINGQSTNDAKFSFSEQSISTLVIPCESEPDIQSGDVSKEPNPTLDRMNLESWKTTSEKSRKTETNPLVVLFKAFVTAFVKFWSE